MNGSAVPNELWLKSSQPVGPWPSAPSDQQIADILMKHVWAGYTTGQQIHFDFGTVDRPQAGTALIAFTHTPPNQPSPVPMDGLRYLPTTPELTTHSTATVHAPGSIHSPQLFPHQVTVEVITRPHGHFPPTQRGQSIPQGSPELRLTRFRKRWRIVAGGGHPGLCLYWWAQDQSGGAPQMGEAPQAPQGWESQPCRNYPVQPPPSTEPIFVFPSRTRPTATVQLPAGPPGTGPGVGGGPPGQVGGSPGGFGAPPPGGGGQYAGSPGQRPPMGLSGMSPAQMAAYQQQQQQMQAQSQYLAQQQQQQQQLSGYPGGAPPQGYPGGPPPPGGGGPPQNAFAIQQQMMQMQQQQRIQQQAQQSQLAQQQAQQAQQQQQQQAQAALRAQQQAQLAQSRGHKGPTAAQQAAAAAAAAQAAQAQVGPGGGPGGGMPPPPLQMLEEMALYADTLDVLSARHLAVARFAKNHDLLASIFDPWTEKQIVEGQQRKVDALAVPGKAKRVGSIVSLADGEEKEEGDEEVFLGLTELAVRGAAVPVVKEEEGEIVVEQVVSFEERRRRLEEMREKAEAECRALEDKFSATRANLERVIAQ